jgi:hypothetical protein
MENVEIADLIFWQMDRLTCQTTSSISSTLGKHHVVNTMTRR